MRDKLEDRLYRVTCSSFGETCRAADVTKPMSDQQIGEAFGELLEHALHSGDIEVNHAVPGTRVITHRRTSQGLRPEN